MSSASVPAPPAVNHRGKAETAVRGAEALWRVPPSHFISPHPHLVKVLLSLFLTFASLDILCTTSTQISLHTLTVFAEGTAGI